MAKKYCCTDLRLELSDKAGDDSLSKDMDHGPIKGPCNTIVYACICLSLTCCKATSEAKDLVEEVAKAPDAW